MSRSIIIALYWQAAVNLVFILHIKTSSQSITLTAKPGTLSFVHEVCQVRRAVGKLYLVAELVSLAKVIVYLGSCHSTDEHKGSTMSRLQALQALISLGSLCNSNATGARIIF